MFVESAFITREFREEQIPVLENVTCLSIVNKGTSIATINGVVIYPTQKQILIVPDGTYSKVQLEVIYTDSTLKVKSTLKIDKAVKIDGNIKTDVNIQKGIPVQNKILLIYKKLI